MRVPSSGSNISANVVVCFPLLEKSEINVKSENDQEELSKNMKDIFPGPI